MGLRLGTARHLPESPRDKCAPCTPTASLHLINTAASLSPFCSLSLFLCSPPQLGFLAASPLLAFHPSLECLCCDRLCSLLRCLAKMVLDPKFILCCFPACYLLISSQAARFLFDQKALILKSNNIAAP